MSRISRIFAITVITLGLVTTGSAMAQQKPLKKIHLNWFGPEPVVLVAKARGLLTAEGLELQVTRTASSTQQMRGISQGTYDIGFTAFDNVLAWSGREGAEIIALAQPNDFTPLPLFVRPDIKTLADLKGKKIAVDAVDTAFALVLRRILLVNGLDLRRGDYELVPVGAPAQRLESMKRGDTFAAIINAPIDSQAQAAGMVNVSYDREAIIKGYPGTVFAVSRTWAQANRTDLTGFLRAWRTALVWMKDPANRDEAIRMVAIEGQLTPKEAAAFLSRLPQDGFLNMAGAKTVLDLRNELTSAPLKGPVLDVYVDLSFYREAAPR